MRRANRADATLNLLLQEYEINSDQLSCFRSNNLVHSLVERNLFETKLTILRAIEINQIEKRIPFKLGIEMKESYTDFQDALVHFYRLSKFPFSCGNIFLGNGTISRENRPSRLLPFHSPNLLQIRRMVFTEGKNGREFYAIRPDVIEPYKGFLGLLPARRPHISLKSLEDFH